MMCWLYFFFFFRPLSPGIPRFCRGFGAAWKLGKGQQGDPLLTGKQRRGHLLLGLLSGLTCHGYLVFSQLGSAALLLGLHFHQNLGLCGPFTHSAGGVQ